MHFGLWIVGQPEGALQRVRERSGVGYQTIQRARHGLPLHEYATAKKLADATDGAVTVDDLCAPPTLNEDEQRSVGRDLRRSEKSGAPEAA